MDIIKLMNSSTLCNLVSHFNKIRDTDTELGSKETFLKTGTPF